MPKNYLVFLFVAAFSTMTALYFWRLMKCLAFQYRTKCTYHALWILPYGVWMFVPVLPEGYISGDCSIFMLILWIFSLVCVIIQLNFPLKKAQKWILEAGMKEIVSAIDFLKYLLTEIASGYFRITKLIKGLKPSYRIPAAIFAVCWTLAFIVLFGIGLYIYLLDILGPQFSTPIILTMLYLAFFFLLLYWCISSCWVLLIFWVVHWMLVAVFACLWPRNIIFFNIIDESFSTYCFICIALSVFWCLSAGIANYDVAKMTGTIVNTFTTILLIAINIVFGWIQRVTELGSPADFEETIYLINLGVFPVVMAGYLAMLFADGIEYWRNRHKLPVFRSEELEDSINPK